MLSSLEKDYIIKYRRHFHEFPELSLKEYHTADVIEKELQRLNISTKRIGETGICGTLTHVTNPFNAKCIGLRADIDALPVNEKTNLPFSSQNPGVMHACGHDGHAAALLGAAARLSSNPDNLNGTVKHVDEDTVLNCRNCRNYGANCICYLNCFIGSNHF